LLLKRPWRGRDLHISFCLLKRREIPESIHEKQDEILSPLDGKAPMWVDMSRSFCLESAVSVRVLKKRKHKIGELVAEEVLISDVICPALA